MNDLEALARLIRAIAPWRAHLIIVGGWAHRLHRYHPLASVPDYDPLLTRDTDLAFAADAPLEGDIAKALGENGFAEELSGDHRPPVTHYTLGDDDAGFYAEFLTPLHGSGIKRDHTPDATLAKAGITAQKLRHLEILLVEPWIVRLGGDDGVPLDAPTDVLISNPVSFIVQKLLIHDYRKPAKRSQDVLYIHDTLELFGRALETLAALWSNSVSPALSERTAREVGRFTTALFARVTDTIRDAARIPQDRRLDPERLRAACQAALAHVLG